MRRRDFLTLAGVTAAWPLVARAQQAVKARRIAFAGQVTPLESMTETGEPVMAGFFSELRRLNLIEGQNVIIDRYMAPNTDIAPEVALRMVHSAPDVIVMIGAGDAALAAMALTKTIPIVFSG